MATSSSSASTSDSWSTLHIALAIELKTLTNTAIRCSYPLAPFIAASLDVSTQRFLTMVAIGEFSGLLVVLLGPVLQRLGCRTMFAIGEVFTLIGFTLPLVFSSFWPAAVGWSCFEFGYNVTAPALQSAVSQLVEPSRIGRITGFMESSWALAGLIGVPLIGLLIKYFPLWIPFAILLTLHAPAGLLLWWKFPHIPTSPSPSAAAVVNSRPSSTPSRRSGSFKAAGEEDESAFHTPLVSITTNPMSDVSNKDNGVVYSSMAADDSALSTGHASDQMAENDESCTAILAHSLVQWKYVLTGRRSLAGINLGICLALATALLFASFGQWLKDHGYDSEKVGYTSFVFGLGEFTGSFIAGYGIDRLGLKKSVYLGACGVGFSYIGVALLSLIGIYPALAGIFCCYVCSEFSIIASISLFSSPSCIPKNRSTVVTLFCASFAVGRMISAFSVSTIFETFGFFGMAITSSAVMLFGVFVLFLALDTSIAYSLCQPQDV